MTHRNEPIQIFESYFIFHQDDLMIIRQLFGIGAAEFGIDVLNGADLFFLQHRDKLLENFCQNSRIIAGTVVMKISNL